MEKDIKRYYEEYLSYNNITKRIKTIASIILKNENLSARNSVKRLKSPKPIVNKYNGNKLLDIDLISYFNNFFSI